MPFFMLQLKYREGLVRCQAGVTAFPLLQNVTKGSDPPLPTSPFSSYSVSTGSLFSQSLNGWNVKLPTFLCSLSWVKMGGLVNTFTAPTVSHIVHRAKFMLPLLQQLYHSICIWLTSNQSNAYSVITTHIYVVMIGTEWLTALSKPVVLESLIEHILGNCLIPSESSSDRSVRRHSYVTEESARFPAQGNY